MGRFISEDPIGFAGGDVNLYGYVRNKPVSHSDPFGLDEYAMMERFANQESTNRSTDEILDDLQFRLATAGNTPFFGEPLDLIDGMISLFRGDYYGAGMSIPSMVPFLGTGAGVLKICSRADNAIPRGGVYRLVDTDTGQIMRTGHTNDLARRRGEHLRDPALGQFGFEPVFKTDDYGQQRGLEHYVYNLSNAPLDKIRPISDRNKKKQHYLDAADDFLKELNRR